ncbi:MAG: hypothetical protein HKP24_12970 [Croceitalea sp.]|nr:hypothetical protein [Croceitalea sp.]
MKNIIFLSLLFFSLMSTYGQDAEYTKRFEHFHESRGDFESGLILTLPYQETVKLYNSLQSNSGLGANFNYYGTVVLVDHMEVLSDGNIQLILRREDGNSFYGYRPTIKAILIHNNFINNNSNNNLNSI